MANSQVGSVYEIAIDDVGYMLADSPERPVRRQIAVLDAQPPGSDAPLSERIGRYDFVAASDWTGGGSQTMADRPSSDTSSFFRSEGLDCFSTPGQITCLPEMPQQLTDTYATPDIVAVNGSLYVRTDDAQLTRVTSLGATTAFNHGLAGTPTDRGFASDDQFWYLSDGATIRRNSTAADPAADWSTEGVTEIAWCTDRLMGVDNVPATAELISFDSTGTGTAVVTLANRNFQGLCGGDGYVWFGVGPNVRGHINFWQVDSSPLNTGVAFVLPPGEYPSYLFFYLGNVFVSTTDGGYTNRIYRCVPSEGRLTPQLITDDIDTNGLVRFAGVGKFVAFTWPAMESGGHGGIGVLDLETGGFTRWHRGAIAGASLYVTQWLRDFAIAQTGQGVFGRDSTDMSSPAGYRTGFFETSTHDLGSSASKKLDEIQVSTLPLPAGTSVAVSYSIDGGTTYIPAATFNTTGATQHSVEIPFEIVSPSFRFKATLTPSGTSKPTVTALIAKVHVTEIADEMLELPINCSDRVLGLNGKELEGSGPGVGIARARTLKALVGTQVTLQDIDWPVTGTTEVWEVVGCEVSSNGVYDRHLGRRSDQGVATLTLRKPG